MRRSIPTYTAVFAVVFLCALIGCSQGGAPTVPGTSETSPTGADLPKESATTAPGHHMLGAYSLSFDLENEVVEVVPNREVMAHYDVTPFLLPPHCEDCLWIAIEEHEPEHKRIEIKIHIKNPFNLTGHDIRAILLHNQQGWDIERNEGYNSLFDDGGAVTINPFVAMDYTLGPDESLSKQRWISYPDNPDWNGATVIIDASWPDHCEDVYTLEWEQDPFTVDAGGSTLHVVVKAQDWQEDIQVMWLDAVQIGGGTGYFANYYGDTWACDVFSPGASGGIDYGQYRLIIGALSTTEVITYQYIDVFLNPLPDPDDVTPGNLQFGTHTVLHYDNFRLISAREFYGIDLFDVSDQEQPIWTGSTQLQDTYHEYAILKDIEVVGDIAFVADQEKTIHVVDISDIYAPKKTGAFDTGLLTRELTYGEGYVYAGCSNLFNILTYIIIDPHAEPSPQVVGQYNMPGELGGLAAHNGYLYFGVSNKICVASLDDPVNPDVIAEVTLPVGYELGLELDAIGDFLYGIMRPVYSDVPNGIFICDISSPGNPEIISWIAFPYVDSNSDHRMCIKNGYCYITAEENGISVFDIDPPEGLNFVTQFDTRGEAIDITKGPNYIYATERWPGGVNVYDPTFPESLSFSGELNRLDSPQVLRIKDNYAYVIDAATSFKVLDIDPPERARIIGSVSVPFKPPYKLDIALDGDVACLLNGGLFYAEGLTIVSVADPENPIVMNSFENGQWRLLPRLLAHNGYAYVSDMVKGLLIVDIDPPQDSHVVGHYPIGGFERSLDISPDGRLYCSSGDGLAAYDLSDPENPLLLGLSPQLGYVYAVAARKNFVYVESQSSIYVLDVSNPSNMHVVDQADVLFSPIFVDLMGGFLFASAGEQGVWIAKIFPPGTVEPVFNLELPEFHFEALDIVAESGYMYVTTQSTNANGLRIYKWW
jgi:hypothetical protein